MSCLFGMLQIQEFRTGATRTTMEGKHVKEENKRLKQQLTELRDKFNDIDGRVSNMGRYRLHMGRHEAKIMFILLRGTFRLLGIHNFECQYYKHRNLLRDNTFLQEYQVVW